MSNDTNNNEQRISAAYRDLASEKTPRELDDKVLAMAAGDMRTRYGLSRAWTRPVAWAATVALSLAFVMEISQNGDTPVASAPKIRTDDAMEATEERVVPDKGLMKTRLQDPTQPVRTRKASAPVEMIPAADVPLQNVPESASIAAEFDTDDMNMLHEAEEQARRQTGAERSVAPGAEKKEVTEACDEDARATAEAWYACVEMLRTSGRAEAASDELDALLDEFPGFREPGEDK